MSPPLLDAVSYICLHLILVWIIMKWFIKSYFPLGQQKPSHTRTLEKRFWSFCIRKSALKCRGRYLFSAFAVFCSLRPLYRVNYQPTRWGGSLHFRSDRNRLSSLRLYRCHGYLKTGKKENKLLGWTTDLLLAGFKSYLTERISQM